MAEAVRDIPVASRDVTAPQSGLAYWSNSVRGRFTIQVPALARLIAHPNFGPACIQVMRVADRFNSRRIFDAYVIELANGLSTILKRGDTSAFNHFSERNAGMGIMYRLTSSAEPDDVFPPRRPIPFSINALAAEFKVSRGHVRKMFRDAGALGYATRTETTVTFEQPLRDAIVEYQAANFFAYASCACAALEAAGETP